jgi:hypothetical protein
MMHLALWVEAICRNTSSGSPKTEYPSITQSGAERDHRSDHLNSHLNDPSSHETYPKQTNERLMAATRWLKALLDRDTGRVPNLGPNDGARILLLSASPFHDYRPGLQAAGRAFLGEAIFDQGWWDELSLWLGLLNDRGGQRAEGLNDDGGGIGSLGQIKSPTRRSVELSSVNPVTISSRNSWGYLRTAAFTSRPGHADQLHFDLWCRGYNIAKDAGTYLYNAKPPWNNSLARTDVHNTITVDDRDQMTRAGRFLWLDWAQGKVVSTEADQDRKRVSITAVHNGYRNIGLEHQRTVACFGDDRWLVEDRLQYLDPLKKRGNTYHKVRLHWLLPDWPWEVEETDPKRLQLRLESPIGWLELSITNQSDGRLTKGRFQVQLIRGGVLLYGSNQDFPPIMGWASPTYAKKIPALSLSINLNSLLPVHLSSEWRLP